MCVGGNKVARRRKEQKDLLTSPGGASAENMKREGMEGNSREEEGGAPGR